MSIKKRIVLRADAYQGIGTGDLVSLITFSQYFPKSFTCKFISKRTIEAKAVFESFGVRDIIWLDEVGGDEELRVVFYELKHTDVFVYEFSDFLASKVYKTLPQSTLNICISLNGDVIENTNILIDWDPLAKDRYSSVFSKSKSYLGPEYVILPKSLVTLKAPVNDRVLVCMGGADELNLTEKVCVALLAKSDLPITVVLGAGNLNKSRIHELAKNTNKDVEIRENISNMTELFANAKTVVCAGGLLSSEAVASGRNVVIISTVDHQIERCKYFSHREWAHYIGHLNFDELELIEKIETSTNIGRKSFLCVDMMEDIIRKIESCKWVV